MRKNRMRTALTGFAVAWGIFMLIILLGAGNGLRNAMVINMSWSAENAVTVWGGWTSMPYKGFPTGRRIMLKEPEIEMLKNNFPEIEHISGAVQGTMNISYNNNDMSAWVGGVDAGYDIINNYTIERGRFINELDKKYRRKVIVLHPMHVEGLFDTGEDPIGKYVTINKVNYRVIGIYNSPNRWDDDPDAWIPLGYAKDIFSNWSWRIEMTVRGMDSQAKIDDFNDRVRKAMGGFKSFNPEDRSAFGLWNYATNML
ncbi:MAG: ABC transporter permease, partial [Rikenellaceae bacterium]|nr:ABC transporter permease [Rikenellaceae bacterium]